MVYVGTVKAPEGLVTPNARDGVIHIQFKTRKMLTKKQAISRATKMLKGYKDAYVQRSLKDIQDPVSGQFKSLLPDIEWWVNGESGLVPQPEGRFVPGRKAR